MRAWKAARRTVLTRRLAVVLVLVSVADLATTAVALSLGAPELSPGGAAVLAAVGLAGLVGLKLVALLVVWLLNQEWPAVGRVVAGGLAAMTVVAVASNVYRLSTAGVPILG